MTNETVKKRGFRRETQSVRAFLKEVEAQQWPDGSPRYPIMTKGAWRPFIVKYRKAVEELYAMRQSGHRLTPHCAICEKTEQELGASNEALEGLPSEDDGNKDLHQEAVARHDAAGVAIRKLRREGHHLNSHCDACREAQSRVRELMNEAMLGLRCLVASYANKVRTRWVNRADLLIEGLLGVVDGLVRFHPDHREGFPIPLLRFDEMGIEVWTMFEKSSEKDSDAETEGEFPSYAYYWVHHRVMRSLTNAYYPYAFRFPAQCHSDRRKVMRLKWERWGAFESVGEVFRRVRGAIPTMKEQDIWDALSGFGRAHSLTEMSESFEGGSRLSIRDLFDPGTFQDAETAVYRAELFRIADGWVRYFIENRDLYTPMQRAILDYRFGFVGEFRETLGDVGTRVGLSRGRAQQVEEMMMAHHGLTSSDLWAIRMIYDAFHDEICPGRPRLVPCMDLATGREASMHETRSMIVHGTDHWCAMLVWAKSGHANIVGRDVGAGQRSAEEVRQAVALVSSPEALIRCLLKGAVIDEGGRALVWHPERILEGRQGLYPKEIEFVLSDLKSRGLIRFLTGMIPIIAISKPFNTLTGSR